MRAAHPTGFKVYALKTTTGEIGPEYSPYSGSWDISLNKAEELTVKVPKTELTRLDQSWWYYYSGGLLLTYMGVDGVEHPIVAGPIYDYGVETKNSLELKAAGIRKIFEYRTIWTDLSYTKMAYGDIAWSIVSHAMDRPGGALPITHGTPTEPGRYQRTYERWNLQNNMIDKRLTELSEVIAGPDIMFRPYFAMGSDGRRIIRWSFVHGTTLSQSIFQTHVPDFDTTSAKTDVGAPDIRSTGKHLRHRVWETGAGEGEGIARVYSEDLTQVIKYAMPMLEEVSSDSDQADTDQLQKKADGLLQAASVPIDQVTITVQANSRKHPLGSFYVGDVARVTLKGSLFIKDGSHDMKIIKASGGLGNTVTLDFQEHSWE